MGCAKRCRTREGPLFIATPERHAPRRLPRARYRGCAGRHRAAGVCGGACAGSRGLRRPKRSDGMLTLAAEIAAALKAAQRPVVIAGPSCRSAALIQAAANVAWALPGAALAFTVPECNSLGLALMDAPRARRPRSEPGADTVIVLENDLYRRAARRLGGQVSGALPSTSWRSTHLETATTEKAELVLPAATFAEGDGTLVSSEGRAQRFFRRLPAAEPVSRKAGAGWADVAETLDDVVAALAAALPQLGAGTRKPRRPPPSSAWPGEKSRASRIATAAARPCWPTSASTNRSRPTIPIRRWPSRWKGYPDQPPPPLHPVLLVAGVEFHPGGE